MWITLLCVLTVRGAAAPPTDTWSGTWTTTWTGGSNGAAVMLLSQSGSSVTGTYDHLTGTIAGTVSGNTLSGAWTQSNDRGTITVTLDATGRSWSGTWTGSGGGGTWTGTCTDGACAGNLAASSSTTAPPPVGALAASPSTTARPAVGALGVPTSTPGIGNSGGGTSPWVVLFGGAGAFAVLLGGGAFAVYARTRRAATDDSAPLHEPDPSATDPGLPEDPALDEQQASSRSSTAGKAP